MVLDNTKGDLFLVQNDSSKPLGEVCRTSQNSLTLETVSHIYDLPMDFSPGVLCNSGGVPTLRMLHVQK
jgi:hypothetical protein